MNWDKHTVNIREIDGYQLIRSDPFGFWSIHTNDERVSDENYTSVNLAIKALENLRKNTPKVVVKKRK